MLWTIRVLNPIPHACKACALPIELIALFFYYFLRKKFSTLLFSYYLYIHIVQILHTLTPMCTDPGLQPPANIYHDFFF